MNYPGDGRICLSPKEGDLFARNASVLLRVPDGGRVCADERGRFTHLAGEGAILREDRWISFSGEGAMDEVQRAFERLGIYQEIRGPQAAVSTSRAFR